MLLVAISDVVDTVELSEELVAEEAVTGELSVVSVVPDADTLEETSVWVTGTVTVSKVTVVASELEKKKLSVMIDQVAVLLVAMSVVAAADDPELEDSAPELEDATAELEDSTIELEDSVAELG